MRAVTVSSASLRLVAIWLTWNASSVRFGLSSSTDFQARYVRTASSSEPSLSVSADEEHEHVPVASGARAPLVEDGPRRVLGLRDIGLAAVGDLGPEDHQGDLVVVGHVRGGRRRRVDAGEDAAVRLGEAQPPADLLEHVVVALLGGAVGGEPVDRGLGAEPVPPRVVVQVGRAVRQPPQRIAERRDGLARERPSRA